MCNRLLATAHLVAHAEACGQTVLSCALRKYAPYFEGLPEHGILTHRPERPRTKTVFRVPLAVLRSGLFPPGEIPFTDPRVLRAEQAALLVLIGWRFRDDKALREHGPLVRALFRPRAHFRQPAEQCLAELRGQCDVVVGVHVRRTDYATFRDGCFFYSDAVYRRMMKDLSAQLRGRVGFLVASDATIDTSMFSGMLVQQAPGHELVDLYALAGCDYILGPPSTYSMWASFYGDVPLCHVSSADAEVTLEAFRTVLGG